MKFVLASGNKNKIRELNQLFSGYFSDVTVYSLRDVGFAGDIEENGTTFEENALIKARVAAKAAKENLPNETVIAIADDSGLEVDALGKEPGVYSARYAAKEHYGNNHDDEANNALLLHKLKGVSEEKRSAAFVCAIAAVFPDGRESVVRGEVKGRILHAPRGSDGFGYDPLFYYEPLAKSFAEIPMEEKNKISHRANALAKMALLLKKELAQ